MTREERVGIGDPIGVFRVEREGDVVSEAWVPATCCAAERDDHSLGAALADGTRIMVLPGQWRRSR